MISAPKSTNYDHFFFIKHEQAPMITAEINIKCYFMDSLITSVLITSLLLKENNKRFLLQSVLFNNDEEMEEIRLKLNSEIIIPVEENLIGRRFYSYINYFVMNYRSFNVFRHIVTEKVMTNYQTYPIKIFIVF